MNWYTGKSALITGASSGIGEAFARSLAKDCTTLILVARSEDKLQKLAQELQQAHSVRVEVIRADLSDPHATDAVMDELQRRGLAVDILINNAGFATNGYFEQVEYDRQHRQVMLNVMAVVDLTHRLLPSMIARGGGGVLNVASIVGMQPIPYMAIYAATKAFVISFSEALWHENRKRGVHVVALCPGATETNFFEVAGNRHQVEGMRNIDSPEKVAAIGLRALVRNDNFVIWGNNRLNGLLVRVLPRRMILHIAARLAKPRTHTSPAQTVTT